MSTEGQSREERRRTIVYWVLTVLLMMLEGAQGILLMLRSPVVTTLLQHLGYPPYLSVFLGAAKLLAVVVIAQPWFATLREWAYAGLTFDLIGAALSHLASNDPPSVVAGPLVFMVVLACSYTAYVRVKRRIRYS